MYWSDLNHITYPSPDEISLFEGNRTASHGERPRERAKEDLVSFYETAAVCEGRAQVISPGYEAASTQTPNAI